jgi:hypothetical protein
LERLVDKFLKNISLVKHAQAAFQYAYRESKSTGNALHRLVSNVEVQLEARGYAVGRFLDNERAFDRPSRKQ